MTNREKYITKRDEYDLMLAICHNIQQAAIYCPIRAIGAPKRACILTESKPPERDCERCLQAFLNEEYKD